MPFKSVYEEYYKNYENTCLITFFKPLKAIKGNIEWFLTFFKIKFEYGLSQK